MGAAVLVAGIIDSGLRIQSGGIGAEVTGATKTQIRAKSLKCILAILCNVILRGREMKLERNEYGLNSSGVLLIPAILAYLDKVKFKGNFITHPIRIIRWHLKQRWIFKFNRRTSQATTCIYRIHVCVYM